MELEIISFCIGVLFGFLGTLFVSGVTITVKHTDDKPKDGEVEES